MTSPAVLTRVLGSTKPEGRRAERCAARAELLAMRAEVRRVAEAILWEAEAKRQAGGWADYCEEYGPGAASNWSTPTWASWCSPPYHYVNHADPCRTLLRSLPDNLSKLLKNVVFSRFRILLFLNLKKNENLFSRNT